MRSQLAARLSALTAMPFSELKDEWQRTWGQAPPDITPDLMARGIAWSLQAAQDPDFVTKIVKKLGELAASDNPMGLVMEKCDELKPGTRLTRSWKGRVIVVTVTDKGFYCDGATYSSLSKCVAEVTGCKCSGASFFGLLNSRGHRA